MKFWRAFDIEIIRLKEGEHQFSFHIDDAFFSEFENNDLLKKGNIDATVTLHKGVNLLEALFEIEGTVELTCDRSLEPFDYPLHIEETILYKYGLEEQEINEEMYMITPDTPKINVAQLIYEFVLLAIPAKKIHPDYVDEMDEEDEDTPGHLVYRSDEQDEEDSSEENTPSDNTEEKIDPRWEALKKIKKKE